MNSKIKKGLGRGLSSLIGETKVGLKQINYLWAIFHQINFSQEKTLMKKI